MIGKQLGPYRILDKLGQGGMGEVYRARDTRLNRDVAIKVLPDAVIGDPERVARFEREAQALAALNHPNIAQIYGIESNALVMELVEGDDLSQRIHRGPIAWDDARPMAVQIALALEAAHAVSIVHRDLKPANVKVRADGTVKVLDFGLAKMADALDTSGDPSGRSAENSPTMTSPAMTQRGVILGTAAHMSPEQARGRRVDKRADIWAFGCVLYEMLTGRPAFSGDTVTDVLAAVVTKEPEWTSLPPQTPRAVRSLLKRCLQKDPKHRLHDIADARIELEHDHEPIADDSPSVVSAVPAKQKRSLLPIVIAAVTALIAGLAAGIAWQTAHQPKPVEWIGSRLGGPSVSFNPRLSPDGHILAFIGTVDGQSQVVMMKPSTNSWTVVTRDRTKGLVNAINWAADSSSIYFDRFIDASNGIYTVPNFGGEERLIIENAEAPLPLTDGSLLFGRRNADRLLQLHRFWPATGKVEPLPFVTIDSLLGLSVIARQVDATSVVVGGRLLAENGADRLYVFNLATHAARPIATDVPGAAIRSLALERDHQSVLIAYADGNMFRVRRYRLDGTGGPESVTTFTGVPTIDLAPDGALFVSLRERASDLLRFDESGANVEALPGGAMISPICVPMPDGRVLTKTNVGGRSHVILLAKGKEPVNLVNGDEDTRDPYVPVGTDRVAVMIGSANEVAVIAHATGRIINRFALPAGVTSLDASPDGQTLYVSAAGTVSAVPIAGGALRKVGPGDSIAVDPDTGDVIAKLDEVDGYRLVRLSPRGGEPVPIPIRNPELRLVPERLSPESIRKGKLIVAVGTVDSWFWFPGVLDLKTGQLTRVPVKYDTDFHYLTWEPDGRILAGGLGMHAALWKFERK